MFLPASDRTPYRPGVLHRPNRRDLPPVEGPSRRPVSDLPPIQGARCEHWTDRPLRADSDPTTGAHVPTPDPDRRRRALRTLEGQGHTGACNCGAHVVDISDTGEITFAPGYEEKYPNGAANIRRVVARCFASE